MLSKSTIVSIFFLACQIWATTITVPSMYPTIQAGLDNASYGDTVLVSPGTYVELITMKNGIKLFGYDAKTCIISKDTLQSYASIIDIDACDGNTEVRFLTIKGNPGNSYSSYPGIRCYDSYCEISDNIIIDNYRPNYDGSYLNSYYGGGIKVTAGAPKIFRNKIKNNRTYKFGGGIAVYSSAPSICFNLFVQNRVFNWGPDVDGAGIAIDSDSSPYIANNVFYNNIISGNEPHPQGGGIFIAGNAQPQLIENNIFCNNIPDAVYSNGYSNLSFNCFFENEIDETSLNEGNIFEDPLFSDPENDDFILQDNSPCIDTGNPDEIFYDPEDPENPGFALYPSKGLLRNDMGAYGGSVDMVMIDSDQDGLLDAEETSRGTDPYDTDSDDDGVLDGEEVYTYSTNPLLYDSDEDGSNDGIEIEVEADPNNDTLFPEYEKAMNRDILLNIAFDRSQYAYQQPYIENIPQLDPPADGNFTSVGLVYQEALAITTTNFYDDGNFYVSPKVRAGLDKLRFRTYINDNSDDVYNLMTYADANANYSSSTIQPAINTDLLPIAGKVISRFVIGHEQPGAGYPGFFDISPVGYVRFNGYWPMIVGSSYRIASHNIFEENEDFPRFSDIYFKTLNADTARVFSLLESELYTGAWQADVTPGEESIMDIRCALFLRYPLNIGSEPHSGFVAYSSMYWKNEDDTPSDSTDEAHDCDILIVGYDKNDDGKIDIIKEHKINNPASGIVVTDFSTLEDGKQLYFALENRDRNANHYSTYAEADYHLRSSYSIQILDINTSFSAVLHESSTDCEYNDNIVLNLAFKTDLPQSSALSDSISAHYITKAYFPDDADGDSLTNQLELILGTNINDKDTDHDGLSDYQEMLNGSDPLHEGTSIIQQRLNSTPHTFSLNQNYPNPFNPHTQISFSVPQKGKVIITVYNVLGQKVACLLNKDMPAGKHKVKFSAHNLSSGVYYYKLQAGNHTAMRKMIVLR